MSPPAPPSTLLVATSDSGTRALLRKALHVRAVEVVEASDGVEALALARRLELDLVLLDAFLAVLDCISVCARIRALPSISQPLIAIMGLSSERTVELAFSEGADEILAKPFHPALIRQRVEIMLRRKQRENRLRLMARALEAAGTGVTIMDARSSEYPVTYANPAFLRMTAYPPEELVGKSLRMLRGPETDVAALTELRDALSEGRPARVLLQNYRKDGATFWNDLSASPIPDDVGRVTHYVAVQTDVSQRMRSGKLTATDLEKFAAERTRELERTLTRVEERRRFVETILNGLVAGLITTDAKGVVSFANRAALHTLGVSLADCVGRAVIEIFGNNAEIREAVESPTRHAETRLDFPLITPGGMRLYVGMSIMPVPEELRAEVGLVFLFRDLATTLEREEVAAAEEAAAEEAEAEGEARPAVTDVESAHPGGDEALPVEGGRRRARLALRYCTPADLIRQAARSLQGEPGDAEALAIEAATDLPEVLVDREQVAEALSRLLGNAAHRAGGLRRVRVRLAQAEAMGERGVRPEPFVRVDVLFPREEITEEDLGSEEGARRQPHRREDLANAEQLLQANGGRLVPGGPETDERCLSALIPAASRPAAAPAAV
jgi:PAS domain S-box-containing protein